MIKTFTQVLTKVAINAPKWLRWWLWMPKELSQQALRLTEIISCKTLMICLRTLQSTEISLMQILCNSLLTSGLELFKMAKGPKVVIYSWTTLMPTWNGLVWQTMLEKLVPLQMEMIPVDMEIQPLILILLIDNGTTNFALCLDGSKLLIHCIRKDHFFSTMIISSRNASWTSAINKSNQIQNG